MLCSFPNIYFDHNWFRVNFKRVCAQMGLLTPGTVCCGPMTASFVANSCKQCVHELAKSV